MTGPRTAQQIEFRLGSFVHQMHPTKTLPEKEALQLHALLAEYRAAVEAEARADVDGPPKSYWMEFLEWEREAAQQGSGMTADQMTGAAMFRSWLMNEGPDDNRPEARADVDGLVALLEAAEAYLDPENQYTESRLHALKEAITDARAMLAGDKAEAPRPSYIEVHTSACHAGSDGDCSWAECPQSVEYKVSCPLLDVRTPAWSTGYKAEAPTPCCEDKGGAFCRDTTGLAGCFDGWEHTREAGDKAEAPR